MSKLQDFRKFMTEYKKMMIQKSSDFIREYFQEEIEILNNITDMTRDWEDDGVEFKYDIYINLSRENPENGGYSQDMGELDLEKFISSFYSQNVLDLIDNMRDGFFLIRIYIIAEDSLRIDCKDQLLRRIKDSFPNITAYTEFNIHRWYPDNIKIILYTKVKK